MGIVSPVGNRLDEAWNNVCEGNSGIVLITDFDTSTFPTRIGGPVKNFDASDYLDSEEAIAEYLTAALENPDPDAFLVAVRDVAKARGIATVAANAGLGRESLYKALRPGAKPRFDTVRRLLEALGVKLDITSPHSRA